MKVVDIISRVRNAAGDVTATQFTDQMLYDWINDGIREIAVDNNLLQKTASSALISGQQDYTLPPDILKLYSVRIDGMKIRVLTMEEWEELNAGSPISENPTGSPFSCYIWAGVLKVWPIPDTAKPLAINYIYSPVVLAPDAADAATAEPVLPQTYHLRLLSYCMAQVALQDDDLNKYSFHMEAFKSGVIALKDSDTTNEDLYPFISVSSRDMGEWCY